MKVAFLDRDGVINKDTGYTYKIEDFEFVERCVESLKILQEKGYAIIIVTNQSGIGRGYYTEADYQVLTTWYRNTLQKQGVTITDVFHCPHAPDEGCECRKPKSGLFFQAQNKYPEINFSQSIMIGDKFSDLEAATAVGVTHNFLVNTEKLKLSLGDYIVYESLLACVSQSGEI